MNFLIIKTSTNNIDIANKISNLLLNKKLSPCVHIHKNYKSNYIWNNKIVSDCEHLVQIKTLPSFKKLVTEVILSNHNYDIPEITMSKEKIINTNYAEWFTGCLKK